MAFRILLLLIVALSVHGAPEKTLQPLEAVKQSQKIEDGEDLKPASSSYSHQYSDWRGRNPGGYEFSVTGYGTIEDRPSTNFGDKGGYNNVGYGSKPGYGIYKGYDGYGQRGFDSGIGATNSINAGYGGGNYAGYNGVGGYGYDGNVGYNGNDGYGGNVGYGGNTGYSGNSGYSSNSGYGGNGGYGGFGGNGGLSSYYGYNNPYYQGNNHLGYGYYNKRPGYGNIYNNAITPSLVTGYRGYSR